MKNVLWICTVCAIVLPCLAADKYYLITSETSSNNGGFCDCSKWSSNGGDSGVKLDRFDPDAEYVVYKKSGCKIYIQGTQGHEFEGGGIILGEGTSYGALYDYVHGDENVLKFGTNGLKIQCGAILLPSTKNRKHVTDGSILVDTSDGAYAYIGFYYENDTLSHKGTLSVSEGDTLSVGDVTRDKLGGGGLKGTLELTRENSCSGVFGRIEMVSATNKSTNAILDEYDTTFAVASTDLPGTLSLGTNCHLKLLSGGDVLKVGTLSLAYNTWVTIPYGDSGMGRIDVTNAFIVGKKIYVNVPGFKDGMERKFPIITAPAGTSMSSLDFVPGTTDSTMWFSIEDIDGRVALYVNYPDVMQRSKSAVLGSTETWSDELPVHEGVDYCLDVSYVTNSGATSVSLQIPKEPDPYVFAGDSLTIGADGRLYGVKTVDSTASMGQVFSCKMLRMMAGSRISLDQKIPITVSNGVLHAVNGVVVFAAGNGRRFIVESKIEGMADLHLTGYENKSSSPYAQYEFNAENDSFMGRIIIRQLQIEDYNETDESGNVVTHKRNNYNLQYNRLTISNALSLGGCLPRPEPKALLLSRYAKLIVKGDTTLAASSNRGIFIEDTGRISVETSGTVPHTFRMETPLAINGTFWKEGAGTLDLAGRAAFGSTGLAESPTANKNNFIVTGGVVRVSNAYAIDGCSMLIHEGTSLELAMDLEDGELVAQGIRNVKTDTPFVLGEGVEKLPVSMVFVEGATPPSTDFTVALLTVSGNAAADVKAMLPTTVKFPFKSYQSTLVETTDEATGDVTFGYRLKYQAMKVIIR